MLRPTARKQGVTLDLVVQGDPPPVPVDESQMEQVLTNLVLNGIQAMPRGGRLEVGLRLESARSLSLNGDPEKQYLAIGVRDDGKGIPEEDRKRIFDPFFTTKEVGQGTGLGLSIAHGIVEEHGGWIRVQSEAGKGSCFTIYLPVEATGWTGES
jgi:signal transduction histidine kinase